MKKENKSFKQTLNKVLDKMKRYLNIIINLFKENKTYLAILIVSIILLIIGTITIGFLKIFVFILLVDGLFIYLEYTNYQKNKIKELEKKKTNKVSDKNTEKKKINEKNKNVRDIRSSELMKDNKKRVNIKNNKNDKNKQNNKDDKNKVSDKKLKRKKIIKTIIKVILIIFFLVGIAGLIALCIFFKTIVDEAPEFDVNNLLMSESSIILDKDGNEIDRIGNEQRETLKYEELSESLIDAIIATEDSRFFQHNGFDLPRFVKAAIGQASGNEDAGGASTLTMQIIKNAYTVKNENTKEKSTGIAGIKRKFTDIYMAIFKLEEKYTKQEILEFYVNYNYLGSSSYGVEQASRTYFNKSAKDLNISEAALIAGLYQSPGSYDPLGGEEKRARAEQRRLTVLNLMERHGYITSEEHEIAKKLTVDKIVTGSRNNNVSPYQSFEDMVLKEVQEKTGWDPNSIPVVIYSTLDCGKQQHINRIMNGETFAWENDAVQGGIAVVDVHNGQIVAIGGGRNVGAAKLWNFATDEVRQIGSTAKPLYDYGPAIEYNNASTYGPVTDEIYSYTGGGKINNWDLGYYGFITYREALRTSRNIPALKTFQSVENSKIYEFVTNLGLSPELENNYIHEAHAIGAYTGETPVSLASAYAAFANKGYYNEPHSFTKVVRRDTGEEYVLEVKTRKAMGEDTAYMISNILQDAANWAGVSGINGVSIAAKTGTTNFDDRQLEAKGLPYSAINDLWVAGYDSHYSVAVWYGYKTITRDDVALGHYTISGNHGNTELFYAVGQGVFTEANFENPGNVNAVTVERETSPAMLPSEFTPGDWRVTELFKAGTEPAEVSQRYTKLPDVTNLKATQNGQKITITWNSIKTPDAINQDYIRNFFNSVYTNPDFQGQAFSARINYNNSNIGDIGYNVYLKKNDGNLELLGFTKDSNFTYNMKTTTNKDTTFVVKASYSIFKANMSNGIETMLNVKTNAKKITATLTTNNTISIKVGEKYSEPTNPVKVMEDSTDVTSKATVKIESITKKSDNTTLKSIADIVTTKKESYEIKYSVKYSDEEFTLIKIVEISE